MQANKWRLFVHPLLENQLERLIVRVEALVASQLNDFRAHPAAKLLKTIRRYMVDIIPRDPGSPKFRLGNALGPDNRHWFRAKFHQRYRFFYRFSILERVIIYAWVNDESSLRKAGSKTDLYVRFKAMLQRGEAPSTLEDLLRQSRPLRPSERK